MRLFSKFLRSRTAKPHKNGAVAAASGQLQQPVESSLNPTPVPLERLMRLVPCDQLDVAELSLLQPDCRPRRIPAGQVLFNRGPGDGTAVYLLDGEVTLDFGAQRRTVSSASAAARYPLACGGHYEATATARTDVEILLLPGSVMLAALEQKRTRSISAAALTLSFGQLPDVLRQSEVFYAFWRTYEENALDLPTLPQVALRLRAAMQRDIGVDEAARIVQTDPLITARLIEIANSPFYSGVTPVATCQQAIARIGLKATRSLVTSLTLGRLFTCRQKIVQRHIQTLWRNSVWVSCLSYVLGLRLGGIDAEQALLAGLMSHIGALPFFYFVADFPPDALSDAMLDAAAREIRGPLGVQLLKAWEFPDAINRIPACCDDWFYSDAGPVGLTDVVILAHWHARLGRQDQVGELPPIEVLPAYQKLDLRAISPEFSLDLLHNAKQQIDQVRFFFTC